MKTEGKGQIKIFSQDSETQNVKNSRGTLRELQAVATNKENLVGRPTILKGAKSAKSSDSEKADSKRKKVLMLHKSVQVGEYVITAEDLISEEASVDYWKCLAEKRGEDLDTSLKENGQLRESLEALQEENKICKELLDESRHLVEVLKEMLDEPDEEQEEVGNPENN